MSPILVSHSLLAFGERLVLARRARELTQEDFAHLADVSRSTVKAVESGQGGVALANTLKVLKALDLLAQFDTLLDLEHDPALVSYVKRRLTERR